MTTRDQVLARIAANLRRGRAGRGSEGHAHRVPARAPVAQPSPLTLARRFAGELEALGAQTHTVPSPAEAVECVVEICARHQTPCVLAWYEEFVGLPGLRQALFDRRIGYDTGWLPPEEPARAERLAGLARIGVGVTGALAGLADSGSVAVVSGPGRSRLASLLPPVHVAVLRIDCLYATLGDLLAAHPDLTQEGSNLVLITGPSRTADIEMTLTRGVHGPGEVHVVLV